MSTIEVTRGVTFRCYDVAGCEKIEVAVEDGVIVMRQDLPDELDAWQARALSVMLEVAAIELESDTK